MKCPKCKADLEPKQYWPVDIGDVASDLSGLPTRIQDDMLSWWNEARRSKHGPRCTWTRAAWLLSLRRVIALWRDAPDSGLAEAMVEGGIEHGWMALKTEYVQPSPSAQARSQWRPPAPPRDLSMQSAIASWKG